MEKYLKHIPLALFCLTIGKLIILSPTWEGAAAALVTGLVAGAFEYKGQDKKIQELEKRIETVASVVNNQAKAIEDTRSSVSTMQLARQIQTQRANIDPVQRVF